MLYLAGGLFLRKAHQKVARLEVEVDNTLGVKVLHALGLWLSYSGTFEEGECGFKSGVSKRTYVWGFQVRVVERGH